MPQLRDISNANRYLKLETSCMFDEQNFILSSNILSYFLVDYKKEVANFM